MNWEAIAAIGEFIGGIAVIVSIIYLALQVRSSANASRGQGQRDNMDVLTFFAPFQNKANRDVMRAGMTSFGDLSEDEKLHFHALIHPLVSQYQSIFADYKMGLMDDIAFESWSGAMTAVLASEGMNQWWQQAKFVYALDFQRAIDEGISRSSGPSFVDLLPYFGDRMSSASLAQSTT